MVAMGRYVALIGGRGEKVKREKGKAKISFVSFFPLPLFPFSPSPGYSRVLPIRINQPD
jgi:hypothetical protein